MINKNATLAYNALIAQFYDPADIYFMSVDGIPGFDVAPSVFYLGRHLQDLANNGSIDNLDLSIYLIGAGDNGSFAMNDEEEILTASPQLEDWLDYLQNKKHSRVTLIYDGNKSGSFIHALMPPEGKERIIITSTGAESAAYFKTEGSVSFSSFFWDRIAAGATIGDAFLYAKRAISYCTRDNEISFSCYRPQHPLIDANGNGIANEPVDETIAQGLNLGDGIVSADEPPLIGSVSAQRQGNLLTITAEITSTNPVERVWAVIRPIGYCPGASEELLQEIVEAELRDLDGDGTYEGSRSDVDYPCKVTVYAMNRDDVGETNSSSLETKIIQPGGDIYEPDNDESQANVIVVNHPSPQPHTLHHPDDEDWVKFYGVETEEGHVYTIEAGNIGGVSCPVVIELYRENLDFVDYVSGNPVAGDKVWLDFECPQNGIYFVRVLRGGCDSVEGEMSYELKVYDVNYALTGLVAGKVEDLVSGAGIDGAIITSDGVGAAISTRGEYLMSEIPGSWIISAAKERYVTFRDSIMIESRDEYIRKDISMYPVNPSGCVNAADCDDGIFCNGTETCVERTCQQGTPPCAVDGIFCNGEESCNEANDVCEQTGNPCPVNLTCDEESDSCKGCMEDAKCDDGLFCTGIETCDDGTCRDGTSPCAEGVECDEETNTCLMPEISIIPRTIIQSHWIPLPLFMSIRGTNTHFSGASKVSFSPLSVMALPMLINQQTLFCMGLMMPGWITGQLPESLEINVTTGKEKATGNIAMVLMPFMMGEEMQETEVRIQ